MDINLIVTLVLVTIIIVSVISILARSKEKKRKDRFQRQFYILSDELDRQKKENLHLRDELKRINSIDNFFFSTMIRLTEKLNPVEIAKADIYFLREYLNAKEIAVFLWDEKSKRLNIVAQHGLDENWLPKLLYNMGEGKVGVTAEKRLPLGNKEAEMLRIHEPYPVFTPNMCYPLVFQDELFGVIAISRSDNFEEREKNLLGVISKITAVALKNTWNLKIFQNLASIDPLTGIYNIGYFKDHLKKELHIVQKSRHNLSIAIIDLDKFKKYNDTHGHQAGDQLLIKISQFFFKYFKKPAILARYGGDEFIVMYPGARKQDVADIIDILLQEWNKSDFSRIQNDGKVTFSAGIASYPEDGSNSAELIKSADDALYAAKGAGGNTFRLHSPKSEEL